MLASEIHYPADAASAISLLESLPDALVFAGGTSIMKDRAGRTVELPPSVLCVHRIPELRKLGRTERSLELGACVTLSEMVSQTGLNLPDPLPDVIESIGVRPLRNLATIGGNLATRDRFMSLWPILACMDAMVELRDARGSRWAKISRLVDGDGRPGFPAKTLLSRVRIPLDTPEFRVLARLGTPYYPGRDTANFACTAQVASGTLASFKLILAGERCFRSRDTENALSGRKLPLSHRDADEFTSEYIDRYREFFIPASVADAPRGPGVGEFTAIVSSVFQRLSR